MSQGQEYKGGLSKRLTMDGTIHKAYKVLLHLVNPTYMKGDASIPHTILKNAKGIAFITVIKAGFVFGGTAGCGIVIAKLPNGEWSGPSSLAVGGMGWGLLIGASATDSVIILNTDLAVKAFSGKGQLKFGGNISVAAGPVGREADASVNVGDGGVAPCYSYSHSRGLFGGISLQGCVIGCRDSDNKKFYGKHVTPSEILRGQVTPPPGHLDLKRLYDQLKVIQKSKTDKYSYRDSTMNSFVDNDGESFHVHPQQASQVNMQQQYEQAMNYQPTAVPIAKETNYNPLSTNTYNNNNNNAAAAAAASIPITMKPLPKKPQRNNNNLPPDWVEVYTDNGEAYYWNQKLNITQWEKPEINNNNNNNNNNIPLPPPRMNKSFNNAVAAVQANQYQNNHNNNNNIEESNPFSITTEENDNNPFDIKELQNALPKPQQQIQKQQAPVIPVRTSSRNLNINNVQNGSIPPKLPSRPSSQLSSSQSSSYQNTTNQVRKFANASPKHQSKVPPSQFSIPPGINQKQTTNSKPPPTLPPRNSNPFSSNDNITKAAYASAQRRSQSPEKQSRQRRYSLEDIQQGKVQNIVSSRKEEYLTEDEFARVFSMSVEEFAALPQWKKQNLKKQVGLF